MKRVTVSAPARLHLGFFDLNGDLGRRYGSVGVAISGISTKLTVSTDGCDVTAPTQQAVRRAIAVRDAVCAELGIAPNFAISIQSRIPPHAGLGSGTQWALAIGHGIAALTACPVKSSRIAALTGRGARSGIGISVFDHGGFVVDLGRGPKTKVPPPLCHLDFPQQWPILLLNERDNEGISGVNEKSAFRDLEAMSGAVADSLCRHILMGIIPAVMERDFGAFVHSLTYLQQGIGDYFAPFQGGERFSSPAIAAIVERIGDRWPGVGVGQSSWGPTAFVFCPSSAVATEIEKAFNAGDLGNMASSAVSLSVHVARNRGAHIEHGGRDT
ncbi:MAG: beta-ribofuranosylaminobenzene 5'-phosphate synthase family protein [Gammaproteobacteria bacterium]